MSIRVPRSVGFGAQRALRPDIATGALPGLARHPNWPIAYWRHRGPASSVRVIPDPASAIYLRYLLRYHALSFRQCFSRTLLEGTRPAHLFGGLSAFYPVPLTRDSTSVPVFLLRGGRRPAAGCGWGTRVNLGACRGYAEGEAIGARHSSYYAVSFTLRCYTATHGILSCNTSPRARRRRTPARAQNTPCGVRGGSRGRS